MQWARLHGGEITVKEADRLTIGRILKVNHAGEYGLSESIVPNSG